MSTVLSLLLSLWLVWFGAPIMLTAAQTTTTATDAPVHTVPPHHEPVVECAAVSLPPIDDIAAQAGSSEPFDASLAPECAGIVTWPVFVGGSANLTQELLAAQAAPLIRSMATTVFECRAHALHYLCPLLFMRTQQIGPFTLPQPVCRERCCAAAAVCDGEAWFAGLPDEMRLCTSAQVMTDRANRCNAEPAFNTSQVLSMPAWCPSTLSRRRPYEKCTESCRGDRYGTDYDEWRDASTLIGAVACASLILLLLFLVVLYFGKVTLSRAFRRQITSVIFSQIIFCIAVTMSLGADHYMCDDDDNLLYGRGSSSNPDSPYNNMQATCLAQAVLFNWGLITSQWATALLAVHMAVAVVSLARARRYERVLSVWMLPVPWVIGTAYTAPVLKPYASSGAAPMCTASFDAPEGAAIYYGITTFVTLAITLPCLLVLAKQICDASFQQSQSRRSRRLVQRFLPPVMLAAYLSFAYTFYTGVVFWVTSLVSSGEIAEDATRDLGTEIATGQAQYTSSHWFPVVTAATLVAVLVGPVFALVYVRQIVHSMGLLVRGEWGWSSSSSSSGGTASATRRKTASGKSSGGGSSSKHSRSRRGRDSMLAAGTSRSSSECSATESAPATGRESNHAPVSPSASIAALDADSGGINMTSLDDTNQFQQVSNVKCI